MALGDRRWRELLARHHALVRERIARYGGREIGTAGDSFLALFDGPTAALLCAASIRDAVRELDLEIRSGVHMGEIERGKADVGGVAVNIGARVAARAEPGEVLVSSTVRDAETGSDFRFEDRGRHSLKGMPGEWQLYALTGVPEDEESLLGTAPRARGAGLADRLPRSRSGWAAVIAGVVLLAAGIGYLALRGGRLSPEVVVAGSAGPGIAILPFDVRGSEHDNLREGMIDLLSTNLDGAGGLRAIDSRTVLAQWREHVPEEGTPDLGTALEVATATGARYAIVGNVVPIGNDMRVLADVYDLESEERLGGERVEGTPDSIFRLVDDLSIALLARILEDEGALPRVDLASVTTHSVQALKAFLEGEALFRRSDFARAIPAYDRAVETDSTFALAYSRMSEAYGWVERGGGPRTLEYLELAERYADRLPTREAELLRVRLAWSRNTRDATELARAASEKYPDDPEAWNLLGEVYHHLRFQSLASRADIDDAFRKATRLDPAYGPAYIHPLDNAFFYADSVQAAQLLPVLDRLGGGSDYLDRYELAFAVAFGDSAARERALETLTGVSASEALHVGFTTRHPRMLKIHERVTEAALRNPDVPAGRAREMQASNDLLRGRIRDAVALLQESDLDPEDRLQTLLYAYVIGVPLPDSVYAREFAFQPADTLPNERLWAGALYALEQGRMEEYRRAGDIATRQIGPLEASGDSTMARLVRLAGGALEGRELMLRGDDEAARRRIEPAFAETGVPPLALWMAELLAEAGDEEGAIRYLETFYPDPWVGRRLAPLYEAVGDRDKALDAYGWMVVAWDEADPEIQELRQQARSEMARLQGLRRE